MFPYFSDLINYFFGTEFTFPIPMFGTMVAISFLVANKLLSIELQRKVDSRIVVLPKEILTIGEGFTFKTFINQFIPSFFMGYKIVGIVLNYQKFVVSPQKYIFSLQGNLFAGILLGGIAVYFSYKKLKKSKLINPKKIEQTKSVAKITSELTLLAIVFGLLGAKLFDLVENIPAFVNNPLETLVSGSGLSIYGGLVLSAIAFIFYSYRNKLSLFVLLDSLAPAVILAYAIGRIGCQLSGDGDWGLPNDVPMPSSLSFLPEWMWAYDYPNNILNIDLQQDFQQMGLISTTGKAWPTPFYETIMATIIFFVLWVIRKKMKHAGVIISIYFILNGIERFFIEFIRINPRYSFFGLQLSQAQYIAISFILVGIAGFIYIYKNKSKFEQNI